jgi:hypothetical protein
MHRRRVKHTTSLAERIAQRIAEIKGLADRLPKGSRERERLMCRICQADALPPERAVGSNNCTASGEGG